MIYSSSCIKNLMAHAIRFLTMDTIQKSNSGHPGMPMGMAEIAVALWSSHLRHNPCNPYWVNRDRFVLSNGHGSMLLYSLLYLTGYDLSLQEIKNFRTLHSKTPGHPEYRITPGVECSTGPLGQGLANAVGMALAEALLSNEFNKPNFEIINHYTYVFVGDGCLMEGISHEACSLAGTLKLKKLIVLYDDNKISIDGNVINWFSDNTPKRFESYNWNVINNIDGHNIEMIDMAIESAKKSDKPTLICCKTIIGKGAPTKEGTSDIHGKPLGKKEIDMARKLIKWNWDPFVIPEEVKNMWDAKIFGRNLEVEWNNLFKKYKKKYPKEGIEFERRNLGLLPIDWDKKKINIVNKINIDAEHISTRKSSQKIIEMLTTELPELIGGSADLSESNLTICKTSKPIKSINNDNIINGNYINYGVREFFMSAAINGLALHGGYIPFGGTFLVFSDYSKSALRMAALMQVKSIFIFTHDSIGAGEDGPTHQPIEQISSLRLIPNMIVWRPADSVETAVAWIQAISNNGPSCLILSRQNLLFFTRQNIQISNINKGGYILRDWDGIKRSYKVIIIATGSEVELAMKSIEPLSRENISVRIVSMPSTNIFDKQDYIYRISIIPKNIPCIAIEAGSENFWYKYVGLNGAVIGINEFGLSASNVDLFEYFEFTIDKIVSIAISICKK